MARSLRNTFRQLVPRRARWLIRVALRLLSGFYVKRALADWRDLSERVASQSAELEAQSEVLYLLLRRLRTLETAVDRLPALLDDALRGRRDLEGQLGRLEDHPGEAVSGLEHQRDSIAKSLRAPAQGQATVGYRMSAETSVTEDDT